MGISLQTAVAARIGCLTTRFANPDSKKEGGETMRLRCIAYVNYVNRQAVNDVVLCGDTDFAGRTLVKKLADYYGKRIQNDLE